jgi:hypothetical protein
MEIATAGILPARASFKACPCHFSHAFIGRILQLKGLLESVRVEQRNTLAEIVAREAWVGEVDELKWELFAVLLFSVVQELVQA